MNYELIAYAQDFTSFLLQQLKEEARKVKQIILFGSVARGEAGKKSDIDIFIEVNDEIDEEKLEPKIKIIKDEYYESVKVKKYWTLLGIEQEISCTLGKLSEWETLKRSIQANGIVLYGKYQESINKNNGDLEPQTILIITPRKNRQQNIAVWRELYGYKQKVKKTVYQKKGLITELGGKKLARGVIILPIQQAQKVQSFLKKKRFSCQIIPCWREK
ncbi:nucleotidyltransferase domain-containing protein [Candidatus Woesearchaeota archaeon]|nr:nucleotidyltransferase domain-containing protein [Candidatus Woesearchaeota archaeon]